MRDHLRGRGPLAVLALLLAVLCAFLNKALTIDDPLFVWSARNILIHPGDPYGFSGNWFGFPAEMWRLNIQNPPLTSYWLALFGSFSWHDAWLHVGMLPFPLLLVAGTMRLARRLGAEPITAGLLTTANAAFMIAATNLMCDVMLLSMMVWSVSLWVDGLSAKKPDVWRLLLAGLLTGLATCTKYFGLSLFPLLTAYTLLLCPRRWRWLGLLTPGVLVVLLWHLWSQRLYGVSHILGAIVYSRLVRSSSGYQFAPAVVGYASLTFVGGCLLWPLWIFLHRAGRSLRVATVLGAAIIGPWGWRVMIAGYGQRSFAELESMFQYPWLNHVLAALFVAAAVATLWLPIYYAQGRLRSPESWLLLLWVGGTLTFASVLNWTVAARNILPLVPPLAIMAASRQRAPDAGGAGGAGIFRWSERAGAVLLGLGFALWCCWADYRWANRVRADVDTLAARYAHQGRPLYFQGHWGFQYYLMQHGALPVEVPPNPAAPLPEDSIMILPQNNTATDVSPYLGWTLLERLEHTESNTLYLTEPLRGIGFYAHTLGSLPMALVDGGADSYVVLASPAKKKAPAPAR